jgi:H+/Cl- antiporter ClcA/predicted transcriptional regulator
VSLGVFSRIPHLRLTVLAGLLGVAAGGAAWVLIHLIGLFTNVFLFRQWGWDPPSFSGLARTPWVVVVAVAGAAVVTLLAKWAPVIRGHGIPEAMEAVLVRQSRISPRAAIAKPLSSAVAIGTGGPFGAEGPIIVTGGALGSLLGQVLHVSASERKVLLACGAAAGMAATFGTPLAAVILAIELLLFEFSTRAFIPLVVATSIAAAVHAAAFGSGPLFDVPEHGFAGLSQLPWYAVLGVACGLLAVVIAKGLFAVEHGYRRLPVSESWHPVIGAVVWASLGTLFVPQALGVGYDVIDDALAGRLALGTMAGLAVGKLVIWWLALASGTSGGTLAPILLISSCFGGFAGELIDNVDSSVSPTAFALVAMAATFGAATRAPFAAIVFVFELTRDFDAMLPLMGATVLAEIVARVLLADSLMTEKLTRRNVAVPSDYRADVLALTRVDEVMTSDVLTLPASASGADALDRFVAGRHSAYPVVDGDRRCVGMVTRSDLLAVTDDDPGTLGTCFNGDVVTVRADDTTLTALHTMVDEQVDHLPVLDSHGRLIGICTRTDVLRARHRDAAAEERQPGWLSRLRLGEG